VFFILFFIFFIFLFLFLFTLLFYFKFTVQDLFYCECSYCHILCVSYTKLQILFSEFSLYKYLYFSPIFFSVLLQTYLLCFQDFKICPNSQRLENGKKYDKRDFLKKG